MALDQLQVNGGYLALAYGRHIVAGHLVLHKQETGQLSVIINALGEGEWDACERLLYNGEDVASTDFHFHPGTLSTGFADPVQGVDAFFTTGQTYNSTAYVATKLPPELATDDRPDKLRGIFRCLKVMDYDENGNEVGYGYSTNPALHAADLILVRKRLPKARIHWPKWKLWRDGNAALIEWNDGTTVRQIPRFESHVAFTGPTTLATALDAICASCGAFWQDDGEQFIFLPPTESTPLHHFTIQNILSGSVSFERRDARERPNRLTAVFRDLDNEFLQEGASLEVKRDVLIEAYGILDGPELKLPNMRQSQAQRLLQRQLRLLSDFPLTINLSGFGDSFHLLPGDFVTLTHSLLGFTSEKCLVTEVVDEAAESEPDVRRFVLLHTPTPLYKDTDHTAIQAAVPV